MLNAAAVLASVSATKAASLPFSWALHTAPNPGDDRSEAAPVYAARRAPPARTPLLLLWRAYLLPGWWDATRASRRCDRLRADGGDRRRSHALAGADSGAFLPTPRAAAGSVRCSSAPATAGSTPRWRRAFPSSCCLALNAGAGLYTTFHLPDRSRAAGGVCLRREPSLSPTPGDRRRCCAGLDGLSGAAAAGHERPPTGAAAAMALLLYALAASPYRIGAPGWRCWRRCPCWPAAARRRWPWRQSGRRRGVRAFGVSAGAALDGVDPRRRRAGSARGLGHRRLALARRATAVVRRREPGAPVALVSVAGVAAGAMDAVALASPVGPPSPDGAAGRRGDRLAANLAMAVSDRALIAGAARAGGARGVRLADAQAQRLAAIDWFSMFFFTSCAIRSGSSTRRCSRRSGQPAANVAKLAAGFEARLSALELVLAPRATLAWLWLVRWRTGRHREPCGRAWCCPPGGGTVLAAVDDAVVAAARLRAQSPSLGGAGGRAGAGADLHRRTRAGAIGGGGARASGALACRRARRSVEPRLRLRLAAIAIVATATGSGRLGARRPGAAADRP